MKDSIFDRAMVGAFEMVEKASSSISNDFKTTKPFDKEELKKTELVKAYKGLDDYQKQAFISQYGDEAIAFFEELQLESDKQEVRGWR